MRTTRRDFLKAAGLVLLSTSCVKRPFELLTPAHPIDAALIAAGENRGELEQALEHFQDPQKQAAMEFLVAETKNRAHYAFPQAGKDDRDLNWETAPEIRPDPAYITASHLIQNVDLTFEAVAKFPWARDLYAEDKEKFFHTVLPNRLGTGPLNQLHDPKQPDLHWRAVALHEEAYEGLRSRVGLQTPFREFSNNVNQFAAAYERAPSEDERAAIIGEVIAYIDIDFLYDAEKAHYFQRGPAELGLEEFLTLDEKTTGNYARGGRCTDLGNISRELLMSLGIGVTAPRIIAWADAKDNHQILHYGQGQTRYDWDAVNNRPESRDIFLKKWHPWKDSRTPAVIYEEEWGNWDAASKVAKEAKQNGEAMPWYVEFYLTTRSMVNVTHRYVPTTNMTVTGAEPGRLVFLGVHNKIPDIESLGLASVAVARADRQGVAYFPEVAATTHYHPFHFNGLGAATLIGDADLKGETVEFDTSTCAPQ